MLIQIPFDPNFYKQLKDSIVKKSYDIVYQEMFDQKIPEFLIRVMLKKALKNGWGS